MADLWERVKKTANEIYATASERAVEGVNLGVKKLDEATLRRELSREFAELGGRTYQLIQRGEAGTLSAHPRIQPLLRRLEELERRLKEKEDEIQTLRKPGSGVGSSETGEESR
jgi:predicted RNase H-like nuclease (RuvC/YqgF family)